MNENFEKLCEMYEVFRDEDESIGIEVVETLLSGETVDYSKLEDDFFEKYKEAVKLPKEAHMKAYALSGATPQELVRLTMTYGLTTEQWFKMTDPAPTQERLTAQTGCHFEEVSEMLREVETTSADINAKIQMAEVLLSEIGTYLKEGGNLIIKNEHKLYDSLLDQRVTGIGVMHLAGYNIQQGVACVDWANYTKFVDGVVQYKEGGKVKKGPYFWDPVLPQKVKTCQGNCANCKKGKDD